MDIDFRQLTLDLKKSFPELVTCIAYGSAIFT